MQRYIAERTNKAKIRPEEQSQQRVVGRIYGMKCRWKGHRDRNRHKNRIQRSGQARLVYVKDINHNIPTTWRWARGDVHDEQGSIVPLRHWLLLFPLRVKLTTEQEFVINCSWVLMTCIFLELGHCGVARLVFVWFLFYFCSFKKIFLFLFLFF